MVYDFFIGSAICISIMATHLLSTMIVASSTVAIQSKFKSRGKMFLFVSMMWLYINIFLTLFISVSIWALFYYYMKLVDGLDVAFYSALVNYTTLGFGDLLEGTRTRIFGPMAAASGILMFSWAAAMIVYVLQANIVDLVIKREANKSHDARGSS